MIQTTELLPVPNPSKSYQNLYQQKNEEYRSKSWGVQRTRALGTLTLIAFGVVHPVIGVSQDVLINQRVVRQCWCSDFPVCSSVHHRSFHISHPSTHVWAAHEHFCIRQWQQSLAIGSALWTRQLVVLLNSWEGDPRHVKTTNTCKENIQRNPNNWKILEQLKTSAPKLCKCCLQPIPPSVGGSEVVGFSCLGPTAAVKAVKGCKMVQIFILLIISATVSVQTTWLIRGLTKPYET